MEAKRTNNFRPRSIVYNGTWYRSLTERAWAITFDALGIMHRYEAQTFDLPGGGRYTPDFYLPDLKIWLEVKPDDPSIREFERYKADLFAQHCDGRVWISRGYPRHAYPYLEQIANNHGSGFECAGIALDRQYPKSGLWIIGCDSSGHELAPEHIPGSADHPPEASAFEEPERDFRIIQAFANAGAPRDGDPVTTGMYVDRGRTNYRSIHGNDNGLHFDGDD